MAEWWDVDAREAESRCSIVESLSFVTPVNAGDEENGKLIRIHDSVRLELLEILSQSHEATYVSLVDRLATSQDGILQLGLAWRTRGRDLRLKPATEDVRPVFATAFSP